MAENKMNNTPPPPPPPYYMQQQKNRWWVPVLITIVVIVGLFFGFIAILFTNLDGLFDEEPYFVKDKSVLSLKITGKIDERHTDSPFQFLNKSGITQSEILTSIRRAKDDDRIEGIYIKGGLSGLGFAKAVEVKDAITDFKESGKFVYAYMDWGSEMDYFLALSADKIYMPREGVMELNGFSVSNIFFKELFDKIGIDFFVLGFEDFKSAGESYIRNNFSDSARYQYQVLLNQRMKYLVNEIADSRGIDKKVAEAAINRGIYTPDSLIELGLIDGFMFEEDVKSMMKKEIFGEEKEEEVEEDESDSKKKRKRKESLTLVNLANYYKDLPNAVGELADTDQQIAVIYASGPLMEKVQEDFSDELQITSKEMIKALKSAREDDDVKVIILRIDSPGGAVITSDAIYEEIVKTREVKPIIASMSDVAASGGYYIAAPCDTIIAHPATITGSIGVVMTVPNVSQLMDNIYLNVDTINSGPAASQLNGMIPFRNEDKKKLWNIASGIYDRFIKKVAENRGMTYDEVRAVAKGRVWTGEDAHKLGLVDELGGFYDALAMAKEMMGLDKETKVYIQEYPTKEDPIEKLIKSFGIIPADDEEVTTTTLPDAMTKYFGQGAYTYLPVYNTLPEGVKGQMKYMINLLQISENEKIMFAMPNIPYIE